MRAASLDYRLSMRKYLIGKKKSAKSDQVTNIFWRLFITDQTFLPIVFCELLFLLLCFFVVIIAKKTMKIQTFNLRHFFA